MQRSQQRLFLPLAIAGISLVLTACSAAPVPKPDAPTLAASDYQQLLDQANSDALDLFLASNPGVDPEKVELVRVVDQSEWNATFGDCLTSKGFPSAVVSDHVETDIFPPEQKPAYDLAVYQCHVEYPIDPAQLLAFTDDELAYLYAYYTGQLQSCLQDQDITIASAPSFQSFKDSYMSGNGWDPYFSVTGVSEATFQSLISACPPWPAGFRGH